MFGKPLPMLDSLFLFSQILSLFFSPDSLYLRCLDHAHPTFVTGHPFKGGNSLSIGQLAHPDLKRFQINTPFLFAPPNPEKVMNGSAASVKIPSFASFFSAYFGGATYQMSDTRCGKMLESMKKCYETSSAR